MDDAAVFFDQPEADTLEFVAIAIDQDDEGQIDLVADLVRRAKAQKIKVLVVAEEVSYYGSMGTTVATVMAEGENLVPMRLVAVRDMYLSSGDPYELMDLAGLNVPGVLDACHDVLERRKRIFAAG